MRLLERAAERRGCSRWRWPARPPSSKHRFMVVGVLVAATPEALVLAGAINPNSIEISAAICTWVAATVAVLDDGERLPRGVLAALTIGAVALAWSRALATLWLLVIAVVVLLAFGDRARLASRLRGRERADHARGDRRRVGGRGRVDVGADVLGNQAGYEPRGPGSRRRGRSTRSASPSRTSARWSRSSGGSASRRRCG